MILAALVGIVYGVRLPVISEAWVRSTVGGVGMAGPLLLIGLMVLAIVASPIPSGPIAVATGALFGTLWGDVFVATGAILGASTCESTFATFRKCTTNSAGCPSRQTALAVNHRLKLSAMKNWSHLNRHNRPPEIIQGVEFRVGIKRDVKAAGSSHPRLSGTNQAGKP